MDNVSSSNFEEGGHCLFSTAIYQMVHDNALPILTYRVGPLSKNLHTNQERLYILIL